MQALRELSGKGVWIQSAAEPDAFRVDPLFTYGCRPESNGSLHSMNYGKLTAGTTKTAIDTAKPSEKGEIITYLSRMGDVLHNIQNGANSLLSRLSLSTPFAMAIKRTPRSLNMTSV